MSYIANSHITDIVINDFPASTISAKITECDTAFNSFAESKGVMSTSSIETNDDGYLDHYECRRWCIFWVCREICADALGKNNVNVGANEKYENKYLFYRDRLKEVQGTITRPMIDGTVYEHNDRGRHQNATIFIG